MWKLNIPTPKGTSLAQNTSSKRRAVTIHPPVRLVGVPMKTKKERKGGRKTLQTVAKLAIRPDHPRRRIKIKLCMVGGRRHVKCDPNRLRGYDVVGVKNGPSPLRWPVAYTTACTTIQAVILYFACRHKTSHMSNFQSIGSGVTEFWHPQNCPFPLTCCVALKTV